jgi:hypothetical protein
MKYGKRSMCMDSYATWDWTMDVKKIMHYIIDSNAKLWQWLCLTIFYELVILRIIIFGTIIRNNNGLRISKWKSKPFKHCVTQTTNL